MDSVDYYNKYANIYFDTTASLDMSETLDRFLETLDDSTATVLDLGCGSGRDSKIMIDQGYEVTLLDASEELCKLADIYTGVEPLCMDMREIDFESVFDGIWACASLLHLPKDDMSEMLEKLIDALKDGGVLYFSVKKGDFEGFRQERYYSDYTKTEIKNIIADVNGAELEDIWETEDVRGNSEQKWINVILRKEN